MNKETSPLPIFFTVLAILILVAIFVWPRISKEEKVTPTPAPVPAPTLCTTPDCKKGA